MSESNDFKITTRIIAQLAGVSPAAVSFALNGKEGVSEETRERILKIASEMNYYSTEGRHMDQVFIAAVCKGYLPMLDQLFYTELNNSILHEFNEPSTNLIAISVSENENGIVLPGIFQTDMIDGIIVYGDFDERINVELNKLNIPIIALDSSSSRKNFTSVYVDYKNAAFIITRYLIELGHTDIVFLGNDSKHDFNMQVFEGFQVAMSKSNLSLKTNRIQPKVYDAESLKRCIDNALEGEEVPTALFCSTDSYAIYAIHHLNKLGFNVPNDISVVGIDDIVISKYMNPALTTVPVDRDEISRLGFELIKKRINGEECESVTLPLNDIIVRESACPPRNKKHLNKR